MKRKLVIGLLIVLGAAFLFKKTNVCSYVRTAWAKFKHSTKDQVPLEFEIERVRNEIAKLDDDVRDQLGPIAEEMASVKGLERRINNARDNLKGQKTSLVALSKSLQSGTKLISYRDEQYEPDEARAQLALDFANYKREKEDLKSQERILKSKRQALRAVRQQLSTMRTLKRDLEVKLAHLEAELKSVRLAQTRDKYQLDDTRLSDIKQSLADIQRRLDVESEKTKLNQLYQTRPAPRAKVKSAGQLTREVDTYFGEDTEPAGKIVKSK
jgi:peptidoglycan hydrolase CwlO-like protein